MRGPRKRTGNTPAASQRVGTRTVALFGSLRHHRSDPRGTEASAMHGGARARTQPPNPLRQLSVNITSDLRESLRCLRLRDRRWPSLLWRQFNHHTASVLRIPAIHALSPPGVNRNSTSSNTATLFVTEKPNFSNSRMLASFFSPMRTTRLSFGTGSGDGEAGSVAYESIICRAAYATPRRRYAGSARTRKCKTNKFAMGGDAKSSPGERHVPAVV